jgi:hypothetical protein
MIQLPGQACNLDVAPLDLSVQSGDLFSLRIHFLIQIESPKTAAIKFTAHLLHLLLESRYRFPLPGYFPV